MDVDLAQVQVVLVKLDFQLADGPTHTCEDFLEAVDIVEKAREERVIRLAKDCVEQLLQ